MLCLEATASFACLKCHQLHLSPKIRIPTKFAQRGHDIAIRNFNVQKLRTFAYLLRAHIRNINMCMYITSASGYELSGCVRAHVYNYMPGRALQKKLLVMTTL